ncbi:RICIN domain-containing protein [Streptomyces guryensis]|uniref:RICIN domain-containing protein n=1 Tax=Streptomyces guryensis TaxID=2886947 RepID=A0A9Q3VYM1_9ACTN|nr:RICIN domain-containing protein [Streptomyces guryensis]MCD9879953.1 RICIN domain-containing protein [Streptomyces guryensis]
MTTAALLAAALVVPQSASATTVPDTNGFTAGNAALRSVDLAGTWSFTPKGRAATSITVPGGGWYKQGFTDVNEAVYSRTVTVPDTGQPQSAWIEFGAVNHQATLSVDGQVVATKTTSFTPSNFDISPYAAPGTTHTISVDVKGRGAMVSSAGKTLVPDAANWSEAIPQGIYRSAFLRVYPAVYVSDTFVRTSVANQTLTYDVSVTNTSGSSRSVTLTGSLASDNSTSFNYPTLPGKTVTVAAHSTAKVTVGPVAWNLGSSSYWWPNAPYRSGYRAQLHVLSVHASTDDGHTSDATYRFGFRETVQNGEYYYLNGVRVNYRGDSLQGADYDRIDNGGKGDAYDTLPGFLPPSTGNGGWPQAVDNYQRLNYNVVRIHQEPASPYMLDVADEMGLMVIDETGIRGTCSCQDFVAGHDYMVDHAKALTLRDRNHPAIIRWSQSNEADISSFDSESFESDLYAAMNGNDGTRPVSVDTAWNTNPYPNLLNGNFAVYSHYIDGIGKYGEARASLAGRPDGEGEYVWNASNTKQGFEWFATATAAKRAKDASDLRPYTLLSGWAGFVPGVRTTDFVPEEGGHPVYGADNLSDPWSNPQIQRIQAAFNPVAAIDLPYWSASGQSDKDGTFPLPQNVDTYDHNSTVTRNITVFNDDFSGTSVGLNWTARLDKPDGTVIASGSEPLTIPLGSRVTKPISFTAPSGGSRVYLVLSTTKSGNTMFTDSVEYLNLGNTPNNVDDADTSVAYTGSWGHTSGETGPYAGTNSYSKAAGDTATLSFVGTGITLHAVTGPNHGIVGVSVDGGAESLVDEYSAARTGDVSIWTSPRLASGTHTIRVRVTGDQRSAATDHYGVVDRFEIAGQPAAGTNYRIVNRNSGKPLAIAGNSTADGAPAVQTTGGGAWTIDAASGGAYTLNYVPSGKALDVNGFSSTVGLQLQQWTPTGGTNQQWYLRPTGDGYFTIVSHDSGLVADDYGWDTGDGAKVVQYTAGGGINQQWQLVPA